MCLNHRLNEWMNEWNLASYASYYSRMIQVCESCLLIHLRRFHMHGSIKSIKSPLAAVLKPRAAYLMRNMQFVPSGISITRMCSRWTIQSMPLVATTCVHISEHEDHGNRRYWCENNQQIINSQRACKNHALVQKYLTVHVAHTTGIWWFITYCPSTGMHAFCSTNSSIEHVVLPTLFHLSLSTNNSMRDHHCPNLVHLAVCVVQGRQCHGQVLIGFLARCAFQVPVLCLVQTLSAIFLYEPWYVPTSISFKITLR